MALGRMPEARPLLPTPVGPMKTMLSALAMKSSSAKVRICLAERPGCRLEGKKSVHCSGSRAVLILLAMAVLGAQEPGEEGDVGQLPLLGVLYFVVDDLRHPLQVEVPEDCSIPSFMVVAVSGPPGRRK
jgi:hypothetical protein